MKKFIAGFVTCAILIFTLLTFGFAEGALNVVLNPYPVYVNGTQIEVEGYNINGFTFLKLADIGRVFDSTTLFNETDPHIDINSNEVVLSAPATTSVTQDLVPVIQFDIETEKPIGAEFAEYKGCRVLKYNGKMYVRGTDLYAPFNIIQLIGDENTLIFKPYNNLDNEKIVINRNDYSNMIKYRAGYFYDITLFSELIGE